MVPSSDTAPAFARNSTASEPERELILTSDIVDYSTLMPNNVGLADDQKLLRALERWYPKYLEWWVDMGPSGFIHETPFQEADVWLRTAVSVERDGWAKFDFVKMPEYRWGILLAPAEEGRTIPFGEHKGEPAWQEIPGAYRAMLRRLIVIQGDTEPASVEQQRFLGATAPSFYDMRNLFQVNVEEGRHLWAMVYLLQRYFGRDGREEAEELLRRRSGDADRPRMLGAFNEETPDWLSFFLFTYFTDRDGKMQLEALAQSGFDPLSRTCRFMLAEEAHHMFVGATGVGRIIKATAEAMRDGGIEDPYDAEGVRALGVIDLPLIQRKLNLHFSLTLDLFGAEESTNAANAYHSGLKGRYHETAIEDDHQLLESTYPVTKHVDGEFRQIDVPALNALNARLRDDYVDDCEGGMKRWNRYIADTGVDFELSLPHIAFHRQIGEFASLDVTPEGDVVDEPTWDVRRSDYLPTDDDRVFIEELMQQVTVPGEFASWIAPPQKGIGGQPVEFEYVQIPNT